MDNPNPTPDTNQNQGPAQSGGGMSPKTIGIVAYLTLVGWIVALVMNNNNKTEYASFHIRQMLGLIIISFIGSWIPFVNLIVLLAVFIFWIIGFIGAVNEQQKEVPLLGKYFQEWFKSL